MSELRGEVKRLMLVCEQEADGEAIEKLAEKFDESELKEMEKLYRGKMAKSWGCARSSLTERRRKRRRTRATFACEKEQKAAALFG